MPVLFVKVRFEDLPDSAEITGKALKSGGYDARGEENCPTVVLNFRRQKLGEVRKLLEGKDVDNIVIDDIRF
jgi:hypothetical protein